MIKKIAHLADIHIPKSPSRHEEYKFVFDNLYKSLKKTKPDRIVIVGDLNNDYNVLEGEQLILATDFLNNLANIAPVVITRGNHDVLKTNLNRLDSIEPLVYKLNSNVKYYNETGFFDDENITWAVWKWGDKKSPWSLKTKKYNKENIVIDLFHDPIQGCLTASGFEMTGKNYISLKDFKGNYAFLGDIHKKQYLDKDKKIAYPSSLLAQNFAEGDDNFHGYLLWDIIEGSVKEFSIENNVSFKNIILTPYTDFDDLTIEIPNPTEIMKVRIIWGTLEGTRNKTNQNKIIEYLKSKYNIKLIKHKNSFVEETNIGDVVINESLGKSDINLPEQQEKIFINYLNDIGTDKDIIKEVIELDKTITSKIDVEELTNVTWDLIKVSGVNFMSYENIDVDFRTYNGLIRLFGENASGKTTLFKLILYILYNKCPETDFLQKYGDRRFVNNKNGATFTECDMVLLVNNEYYGIKRRTDLEFTKDGEIKASPTKVKFYLLNNPDDKFSDFNLIENLDERKRDLTQNKINKAIGTYENFLRVVMTTSDTLNKILDNNKAEFVDSLLYDSGLDIFDRKLKEFKKYYSDVMKKPRVNCNVDNELLYIQNYKDEIDKIKNENKNLEDNILPDHDNKIEIGTNFIDDLNKKIYPIDENIRNLDVDGCYSQIKIFKDNINELNVTKEKLSNIINSLKSKYDNSLFEKLNQEKEELRDLIVNIKSEIKEHVNEKNLLDYKNQTLNGEIYRIKERGGKLKEEIQKLLNSKTCPTCNQEINKDEHKKHIQDGVSKLKTEIKDLVKQIAELEGEINKNKILIIDIDNKIINLNKKIETLNLNSNILLEKIGEINNDKNEVERREKHLIEYNNIPLKIESLELKIQNVEYKINEYNNLKLKIEENNRINEKSIKAKERLIFLKEERDNILLRINNNKSLISNYLLEIKNKEELIKEFRIQERNDDIMKIYAQCIHRDGIPTNLLIKHIIPTINKNLKDLLNVVDFKVWLDESTLRLKFSNDNKEESVIDALSASGKERTFASVCLKYVLNKINAKSKPTMFFLDEIMGKLTEESAKEFIELLEIIKQDVKILIIVEHYYNVNPDYVFHAIKNENYISELNKF